jgi:hypothetical protein
VVTPLQRATRTAQDSSDAKASEPSIHDDNDGDDGDAGSGSGNDDDDGRPNPPAAAPAVMSWLKI